MNSESDLVVLVFKGRPRCSNHSHHRFLVRHCCLKTGRPKDRRIGSVVEREREGGNFQDTDRGFAITYRAVGARAELALRTSQLL